jgi:hypothetical protein
MSKNIFTHRHRDAFGVCYYYNVAKGGFLVVFIESNKINLLLFN